MEKLELVFFSLNFKYDNQGKTATAPKGWNMIEKSEIKDGAFWNGLALSFCFNTQYEANKYLCCVDVDTKHGGNGLEFLKEYGSEIETIKEITFSGGFHYYFYMTTEEYNKYVELKGNNKGAVIKNGGYSVDFFVNGGYVITAPTPKYKINYKLTKKDKIQHIPNRIYEVMINELKKKNDNKPKNAHILPLRTEYITQCEVEEIKEMIEYINIPNGYDEFWRLTSIIKNLNSSFECFKVYDMKCKECDGYNGVGNLKIWNNTKPYNISILSLFKIMKQSNIKGYKKIIKKYDGLNKDFINSFKFNSKYVGESEYIKEQIEDWKLTDETNLYKFDIMAIKSPYGSGKTYLLKELIKNNNFEKIAYISYRRTLEQQIFKEFEEFKFNHYLTVDNIANADRIIIQIDSILKMSNSYDLIIIDEIESVLNHISSSLIESEYLKSQKIFNKLTEILTNSNKILVLDGDLSIRTEDFIKCINKPFRIYENTIKDDEKIFIETNNINVLSAEVIKSLDDNKKIIIISQSAKKATQFYNMIINYKNDIKIAIYTGKTDDLKKKEDLENIMCWNELDCLIYSPTIESGVNFDLYHFDKMYIITSPRSCSYRSLKQMERRVRHLTDNKIMIYINGNNKGGSCEFTFNEVKEDYKLITGISDDNLRPYDILKIHNEKEKLNNMYAFFYNYKRITKGKNGKIEDFKMPKINIDLDKKYNDEINKIANLKIREDIKAKEKKNLNKKINDMKLCQQLKMDYWNLTEDNKKIIKQYEDNINKLNEKVEKIDIDILKEKGKIDIDGILNKQKEGKATAEDKERIKKYIIAKHLGLNYWNLEEADIKQILYYEDKISNIYNYLSIGDDKYIKNLLFMIEDNKKEFDITKQKMRVEKVREIIKTLGINKDYKQIEISNNIIIGEDMIKLINEYKTLNMDKKKVEKPEYILRSLNNILKSYCFIINSKKGKNGVYNYTFTTTGEIEKIIKNRENKFKINIDIED